MVGAVVYSMRMMLVQWRIFEFRLATDFSKFCCRIGLIKHHRLRDGFKKKKLMEFSIKLAGWVLDAPVFH